MIGSILVAACLGQAQQPIAASPQTDVRCGSLCLYVALQALGIGPATHQGLEDHLGLPGPHGYSLLQLESAAKWAGARTIAVETSLENLQFRDKPFTCLTIIDKKHFILMTGVDDSRLSIIDPPRSYELSRDAFRAVWSGKALLIGKSALASEESIKWRRLLREALPIALGSGLAIAIALLAIRRLRRKRPDLARARLALLMTLLLHASIGCDRAPSGSAPGPLATPTPEASSWLMIREERKDLGLVMKRGDEQEERFQIALENRGPEALEIRNVETSCGCTRTVLSRKEMEPGGSAILTGFVRIGDNTETNSARVYVTTSDPMTPRREILVTWQVQTPLRTPVSALNLPPVLPGEAIEHILPIQLTGLSLCQSCRLQSRSGSRSIAVEAEPLMAERSSSHERVAVPDGPRVIGQLRIKFHPQVEESFYTDSARLELICGDDRRASCTLPISWSVAPPIQIAPSRVYVGESGPGQVITTRVVLHSRKGQPFRVLGLAADGRASITTPACPSAPDVIQHLEVTLTAPQSDGAWRTIERVRTDSPGAEDVALAVSGIVTRGGAGQ